MPRANAIIMFLSLFFEARTFARQFGTQEAGDHLLEGPKKAGFIEHRRVRARSPKLAESRLKPVTNTTIN
jgi:hypothetical protein